MEQITKLLSAEAVFQMTEGQCWVCEKENIHSVVQKNARSYLVIVQFHYSISF